MYHELIALVVACILCFLIVMLCIKIAVRIGFVDKPNPRKTQKQPLPMLGGLGMVISFLTVLTVATIRGEISTTIYWSMFASLSILSMIGFLDDAFKTKGREFPALPKLAAQIAAAVVASLGGIEIHGINIPLAHTGYIHFSSWVSLIVSVIWMVGVINALNFIDGLDGLAAGISAISGMSLMIVASVMGEGSAALIAAALVGTSLGYVRHNFFPAKIIMGDTGSMFLGFALACVGILGALKSVTVVSVCVPIVALGLPILDGLHVVIRRLVAGRPIYGADRTHTHYRLVDSGFHPKLAVTLLYVVGACFGMGSCVLTLLHP